MAKNSNASAASCYTILVRKCTRWELTVDFKIVTDSSANLTDEMIERFNIAVLPLRFMSDGEEFQSYNEGEKSDLAHFYKLMRDGKVFTTSLPYPDKAEATFKAFAILCLESIS